VYKFTYLFTKAYKSPELSLGKLSRVQAVPYTSQKRDDGWG